MKSLLGMFFAMVLAAPTAPAPSRPCRLTGSLVNNYGTVTTTDTTETILVTADLPEDSVFHGRCRVVARATSGGAGKAWNVEFVAKRIGAANATLIGSATIVTVQGDAVLLVTTPNVAISGYNVRITVIGLALTSIDWYGEILGLQLAP